MKDTCKDVVDSIAALTAEDEETSACDDEKAAEDNIKETQSDLITDDNELVIASQAKLLMDCSEMMWSSGNFADISFQN